jgi:type II secretion system protein J
MKRLSPSGFTMIEIVVAVAILLILSGIAIPVSSSVVRSARISASKREMAGLAEALRAYGKDYGQAAARASWGRFPPETTGSGAYASILGRELETDVDGVGWDLVYRQGWSGPYIEGNDETTRPAGTGALVPVRSYQTDAWGRYYTYRNQISGAERTVTLISGGPDRDPATTSDNIQVLVYRGPTY